MQRLKFASLLIAAALMQPIQPSVAQTGPSPGLMQSVDTYAKAWASRDADRIAALHSEDSVFQLFVDGMEAAKGKAAIRTQFAKILADNPQYSSTLRSVLFGGDFVIIQYDIAMTPPKTFTFGRYRYTPTGKPYKLPAIDEIHFRDGLVTAKYTYLDTSVVRANSKGVALAANAK